MTFSGLSNDCGLASEMGAGPVFMCSGQGSQKPGMGADLMQFQEFARVFECASDVLGRDVAALVAPDADPAELNDTRNAQVAIAAFTLGVDKMLAGSGVRPGAVLGFSLGQISALAVSGMVSLEDAFRIIDVRSRVMGEAADAHPGVMSAFLKADPASVEAVCAECANGQVLAPANYNCPGQIVVAGEPDAVARAEEAWKAAGKRATRLATSGAFHSPLMASAADPFKEFLETIDFADPCVPLICNTDAQCVLANDVVDRLVAHLTHPVRFEESVRVLADAGATDFAEVGFGGVLSGLVRRIDGDLVRACVQNEASFTECVHAYARTA